MIAILFSIHTWKLWWRCLAYYSGSQLCLVVLQQNLYLSQRVLIGFDISHPIVVCSHWEKPLRIVKQSPLVSISFHSRIVLHRRWRRATQKQIDKFIRVQHIEVQVVHCLSNPLFTSALSTFGHLYSFFHWLHKQWRAIIDLWQLFKR